MGGESWVGVMERAHASLQQTIDQKLQYAVLSRSDADIERSIDNIVHTCHHVCRFVKLYPLLNQHEAGLQHYAKHLCSQVAHWFYVTTTHHGQITLKTDEQLTEAKNSTSRTNADDVSCDADPNLASFIDLVTNVYEHIALLIEAKQPFVETYFGLYRSITSLNTSLSRTWADGAVNPAHPQGQRPPGLCCC